MLTPSLLDVWLAVALVLALMTLSVAASPVLGRRRSRDVQLLVFGAVADVRFILLPRSGAVQPLYQFGGEREAHYDDMLEDALVVVAAQRSG